MINGTLCNGCDLWIEGYSDEQSAIAAWNTLATPDPLDDPRVVALVEAANNLEYSSVYFSTAFKGENADKLLSAISRYRAALAAMKGGK